MKDKSGRKYLKLADAKHGLVVELDAGFTCRKSGEAILQCQPDGRAFFYCDEGRHFLDGQADNGITCVGIYYTAPRLEEKSP